MDLGSRKASVYAAESRYDAYCCGNNSVVHEPNLFKTLTGQWGAPAGGRSDIGGSYAGAESGLSKITLEWMLCRLAGRIVS